jgi:hypothetical protein
MSEHEMLVEAIRLLGKASYLLDSGSDCNHPVNDEIDKFLGGLSPQLLHEGIRGADHE